MTVEQAVRAKELFLTVADVAPILGVDAQSIRMEAARDVPRLGFPVIRIGNTTKIPRVPFLRTLGLEVKA